MSGVLLDSKAAAPGVKELIVSSDSHVTEPHDLWQHELPAKFRAQAPEFPPVRGGHKGGTDGRVRLEEMAADGVSGEVLYPSYAASLYAQKDPALQEACFRVYNEWIREYIGPNSDRLVGIPSISVYNIDHAVQELERSYAAGLRGGPQIWGAPPPELAFSSPHYEPLWEAAEALGLPVNLHVNSGPSHNRYGREGSAESFRNRVNLRTLDGADAIFDLIFSGVLQRHPKLRFVLAEHQIGWVPFYLEQWDWFVAGQGSKTSSRPDLPIDREPSYYYYRQIYSTFFNDYAGGRALSWWDKAHDNTLWISDFPHANSSWPNSRKIIDQTIGHLAPDVRSKLLHGNAAKLWSEFRDLKPLVL